jgi:hypothetical protein
MKKAPMATRKDMSPTDVDVDPETRYERNMVTANMKALRE